ncbi:MAG: right-handed parallel beta-helix repeat-containing protein [Planctomycetes bacterium]|nr:right-handed parallel beta-helix repeat-containing protein [Planctomycetota bacterium]
MEAREAEMAVPVKRGFIGAGLILLALFPGKIAGGAEIRVPGDFQQIQPALDAARDGDAVILAPGEHATFQPLNPNRLHDPRHPQSPPVKNIVLKAESAVSETVIRINALSLQDPASVLIFDHGEDERTAIEGLTFTGGRGTRWGAGLFDSGGGGVLCLKGSSPVFRRCVFKENLMHGDSSQGGGAGCWDSSPRFVECSFLENRARGGGGGVHVEGIRARPVFENCTISKNTTDGPAGGMACLADAILLNCAISGNRAASAGGVSCGGAARFDDCTVSGNIGGGLWCRQLARVALTGCTISGNQGGSGLLAQADARLELAGCLIEGNQAAAGAGMALSAAKIAATDCEVRGNLALDRGGGALLIESAGEWARCTVRRNLAANSGAGMACEERSAPRLINCRFSENLVLLKSSPPGVRNWGGGGIFCDSGSAPLLSACTLAGNAAHLGGGVSCAAGAAPRLENCLLLGNLAHLRGGALLSFSSAPALANCTLSGNSALRGGAVECSFSIPSLLNCIIWGNRPNSFCGGASHSLVQVDPRFASPGAFDFSRLVTVAVNGQSYDLPDFIVDEGDYHLLPGSPALQAGAAEGAPVADFDGLARPCGGGVDIGAYEFCEASAVLFQRGDVDSDGERNTTDAVLLISYQFLGGPAPGCVKSADTDDNGAVEVTDAVYLLRHLYLGEPPPPEPFATCGEDGSEDDLTCENFPRCQN